MDSVVIGRRFCGPPNSGNGGYVCGLLARRLGPSAEIARAKITSAEITLLRPPPLDTQLSVVAGGSGVELRRGETVLATGRAIETVGIPASAVPVASYDEAVRAAGRTPYDEDTHALPGCFVCGPARAEGDGLRIFAGPLSSVGDDWPDAFAAPWIPDASLLGEDGRVAEEFVWAALDCPGGYAVIPLVGGVPVLLGRLAATVRACPKPGERCVLTAWPIGRDGRKLHAGSALLAESGEVIALARATWIAVERAVQLGEA